MLFLSVLRRYGADSKAVCAQYVRRALESRGLLRLSDTLGKCKRTNSILLPANGLPPFSSHRSSFRFFNAPDVAEGHLQRFPREA